MAVSMVRRYKLDMPTPRKARDLPGDHAAGAQHERHEHGGDY